MYFMTYRNIFFMTYVCSQNHVMTYGYNFMTYTWMCFDLWQNSIFCRLIFEDNVMTYSENVMTYNKNVMTYGLTLYDLLPNFLIKPFKVWLQQQCLLVLKILKYFFWKTEKKLIVWRPKWQWLILCINWRACCLPEEPSCTSQKIELFCKTEIFNQNGND